MLQNDGLIDNVPATQRRPVRPIRRRSVALGSQRDLSRRSLHRSFSRAVLDVATPPAPTRRLANVSRQRAHEFCWPASRCDDRKLTRYLAYRGANSVLPVLATITKARQGGSISMAGPKLACSSRRDHDLCFAGELHSVHGRLRGD